METHKEYVKIDIRLKRDKTRNTKKKKNESKRSDKENRLIKSLARQNLPYKDNKTIEEENSEKEISVEKVKSYLNVKSNVKVKSEPSTVHKTEDGQVLKPHDVNKDKTNFSEDRKCNKIKVENKNVFKGKSDENFCDLEWKVQQIPEKMKHDGKPLGIKGGQLCQSAIMVDKNGKIRMSNMDIGNQQTSNYGGVNKARSPEHSLPGRFTPSTSRQQSLLEQTPVKELFVLRDAVENGCKEMESCDNSEKEKDDIDENEKFQKVSSEMKQSSEMCDHLADKPSCEEHILSAGGTTLCSESHLIHMGGTCQLSLSLTSNEIIESYDSQFVDDTLCNKIFKNLRNQQHHLQKFETEGDFVKEIFTSVDVGKSSRKQEQNQELADNKTKYIAEKQTELESKNETGMDIEDRNVESEITDTEIVKAKVMDKEDRTEKAGELDGEDADKKAEEKESKTVGIEVIDWERKAGDLKIFTSSLKEMEKCTTRNLVTLENLQNKLQELSEHLTRTFRKRSFPRLSFLEIKGQGHRLSAFKGPCVQVKEQNPKEKFKKELDKWNGCKSKGDNLREPHDADSSSSGNTGSDGKPPCGNSNGRDSGHSNKENSRHHDDEKDIDEQEHPPGKKENGNGDDGYQDNGEDHDKDKESTSPSTNHKFRRKYGMDADILTEFLGRLANSEEDIPPDILHKVDECLVTCLTTKRSEGLDKLNDCNICVFLLSLLRHFGWCTEGYQQCVTCLKLFSLLQNHLQGCTQNATCTVIVCQKIQEKIKGDPEKFLNKTEDLWKRLKKYLARCASSFESGTGMNIGVVDEFASMGMPSIGPLTSGVSMGSFASQSVRMPRVSTTFEPSLGIIFENFNKIPLNRSYPSGKKSSSAPIATRNKLTGEVTYSVDQETLPSRLRGGRASVTSVISRKPSIRQPRVSFAEPPPAPDEVFKASQEISASIQAEGHNENYKDLKIQEEPVSLNHEKTYGTVPTFSMPLGYKPEIFHEQLLSLEDQPTGTPGVNEVVYGTRKQLKTVIKHWSKEKEMIQKQGQLSHRHIREEGVILVDHKEKFEIFRTRYQKNFQWIRLTHLGSGMSGKCHLAMDYNTEYRFCIKKIYLAKYEELELDVWSDLNHSNIVQLHGAIRRGIKVYIFAEFIDGGCLTKTINDHKMMNRRLSHRMALLYLRQLLQVLVYLEKKSVIHEDIKADNILLRQNSTQVVLTDFGVASRFIQHRTQRGTSPIGTPATFSPEKAQSRGHGVKSDVWSAICVLIHMLSGSLPWVKRFPFAKTLNYIIASKEAPVNDLPQNVSQDVKSLVEFGLIKDPEFRPTAAELLQHRAFKVLDEFSTADTAYSVLMSSDSQPTNNTLDPVDETDKAPGTELTVGTTESSATIISKIDEFLSTQFEGTNFGNETQKSEIPGTQWYQSEEINSGKIILSTEGNTEAGNYSSKHLGVVLPPEAPTYTEEDPMMYLKEYLHDPMRNWTLPPRNAGEVIVYPVNTLQLYDPKPRERATSTDSEEDIDEKIKKIIEPDSNNALPDFNALFNDNDEPENMNLPDEFQNLMTKALTQGIQKSQQDKKDTLTIHRSTSSREDSAKLDQELLQLQMQVDIEVIDIENHESLMNLLRTTGSGQNHELLQEPDTSRVETEESPLTTLRKSTESSENAVGVNIPNFLQCYNDESPTDVTPVQLDPLSLSNKSGSESHEAEVTSAKMSDPGEVISPASRSNNSSKTSLSDRENPAEPYQDTTKEEEQPLTSTLPHFDILASEEESCHSEEMFGSGLTSVARLTSQTASTVQCTDISQVIDIKIDKSSGAIPKSYNTAVTQSLYDQQLRNIDESSQVIDKSFPVQPTIYPPGNTSILGNNSVLQEPTSLQPDIIYRRDKETGKPACEPASLQYQSTQKSSQYQSTPKSSVGQSSSIKREGSPRLDFRKLQKGPRNRNRSESSLTPVNPDKPKKPTFFTPQQEKQYIGFSNDPANITSGLGTGSSSKSAPFFGTGNGNASSGIFSSSPDDKKRDFKTIVDQHDQEIYHLIRDMSHHSEASHDTSLLEDLDEIEEKKEDVQFFVPSGEDEEIEYQSLLQYTNEMYVKENVTDKHNSSGILVQVMLEEEKLFEMKLQGEHVNEPWETILEKEINDKIHDKGVQRFTIVHKNGKYLELGGLPTQGKEVLQVLKVDADDCNNHPWHCDSSVMMK